MGIENIQVGKITRHADGSFEGKIQRTFADHERAAVWKMLTDSACLPLWLAPGTIDPCQGGRARISFEDSGVVIDSEVSEYDAPNALAYSWSSGNQPQRLLHWQLCSTAEGILLTLTVSIPTGEDPAKACAGFEAHLEMLAAALEGVSIKFPFELYVQARTAYSRQMEQHE